MTDPIADMLTRIRNAHMALHKEVSVPRSKMKEALAAILQQEGYVNDVVVNDKEIKIDFPTSISHDRACRALQLVDPLGSSSP
jgi:ribosomal protein S8